MNYRITRLAEYATEVRFLDTISTIEIKRFAFLAKEKLGFISNIQTTTDAVVLFHSTASQITEQDLQGIKFRPDFSKSSQNDGNPILIPVDYGAYVPEDIEALENWSGLRHQEIIRIHSQATYTLAMYGFVPGFCYLSGLPESLQIPRKATPGKRVPPGSVAIAAEYSGIYPGEMPGGWFVIGRTDFRLGRFYEDHIEAIAVGTHIKFKPVVK
jgi:KipI family sensor histidine kinase inhibitor